MLCAVLALVAAAAPAAKKPDLPVFEGVTMGQTARQLVAERGEPLGVRDASGDSAYLYFTPDGNDEEFVHLKNGRVVAVAVGPLPAPFTPGPGPRPSALGVGIGDPASALSAIRKDRYLATNTTPDGPQMFFLGDRGVSYAFLLKNDAVAQIAALISNNWLAFLGPGGAMPVLHQGESTADAIPIKTANADVTARSEDVYIAEHPCDASGTGNWIAPSQTQVSIGGKTYDKVSARCSVNNSARDFYFDTGSIVGRN